MAGDDLQAELERTRALLAQARADRDALQERVLILEDQVRVLRRIPGMGTANRARLRIAARRAPRTAVDPPAQRAQGPLLPGRYLDVTTLRDSARTGIARVTIRLARELGYGLVTMTDGQLVHDTTFFAEIHGRPAGGSEIALADIPLAPGPGVVVVNPAIQLGTDFAAWREQIQHLRGGGGTYVQIVHDLLPITLPDFFDYGMRRRFPQWLTFVVENADLILTDSVATKTDLESWWATAAIRSVNLPPVQPWPLGCDPLPPPRPGNDRVNRPTVLVVGTVEPRKAVDVVVDAVSTVRDSGRDIGLVIVGSHGWVSADLAERLTALASEPWFEWHTSASDAELSDHYASAAVLVAATRGEGYGLPLAEARAIGLPVVARDLPVFRELLGDDASYFTHDTDLAGVLDQVLRDGSPAQSPSVDPTTWREAATAVDAAIGRLTGDQTG